MRIWELTIEYCDGTINRLYDNDVYYLLFYSFTAFDNNPRVKKLKLKTVKTKSNKHWKVGNYYDNKTFFS